MTIYDDMDKQLSDRAKERMVRFVWRSSLLGVLVFGLAMVLVYTQPKWVSQRAREFIGYKLNEKVLERNKSGQSGFRFIITKSDADTVTDVEVADETDSVEKSGAEGKYGRYLDAYTKAKDKLKLGVEFARQFETVREHEAELKEKVDEFVDSKLPAILSGLVGDYIEKKNNVHLDQLKDIVVSKLDVIKDDYLRGKLEIYFEYQFEKNKDAIMTWEKGVYNDFNTINHKLIVELKIFTLINLTAYVFLMLICKLLSDSRATYLIVPAVLLFCSTLVTCIIYIFVQDWFHAYMYSDYWGWSYLWWYGGVFVFLVDVVFLNAFITRLILEAIVQLLSTIASALG